MTRVLWVDATSGAAGDMLLAALIDVGASAAGIRRGLERLAVDGWKLRSRRVVREGLAGRRVDVHVERDAPGRGWRELRRILDRSSLGRATAERARRIFRRLVEAEAKVHGVPVEKVHLHEAGGIDAIVDVVGTCVALEQLEVGRIVVSPMTTGWGSVDCAHGRYPVPGPATAELVRGCPVRSGEIEVERLTPTGAAILTTLADDWGPMPLMRPRRVGYGAGSRDLDGDPNMLRLVLGDAFESRSASPVLCVGEVAVLECTVDDVTPKALAHAATRLLGAGALDVFVEPVGMKKGRSGHRVTLLARPDRTEKMARRLIEETGTLGVRFRVEGRYEVSRSTETVATRWGPVRVKAGILGGRRIHLEPEHDDCADLAARHGVALRDVHAAALESARRPRRTSRKRTGGKES